ncbi:DUF3630 family protein [Ferrimonas sediminicola]|uniref:DUF3630 family protein n=1 Tax=Ferrimonas sediminicola TaxID=2569538 RepID=A0A4U1BIY5_9GAMM|nr:DUF3630 family protein [Ferrimonas sediminicola]TKB51105.1 DUF3630 family protein [Ferrimonas sediminicola]
MGQHHHPLLFQLGRADYDAGTGRLCWHCALAEPALPELVAALALELDCRLGDHQWGADRHCWSLEFEGTRLRLQYELLCDSLWLEAERADERDVVAFLAQLWSRQ